MTVPKLSIPMPAHHIPEKIPFVGVGCIIVRDGELLLVRDRKGFWSTPGGHLCFGESPDVCAVRETLEETGISVSNVQFVALVIINVVLIVFSATVAFAAQRRGCASPVAEVIAAVLGASYYFISIANHRRRAGALRH